MIRPVYVGEPADSLLRRFEKQTRDFGVLADLRRHRFARSKAQCRRDKSAAAQKRDAREAYREARHR